MMENDFLSMVLEWSNESTQVRRTLVCRSNLRWRYSKGHFTFTYADNALWNLTNAKNDEGAFPHTEKF